MTEGYFVAPTTIDAALDALDAADAMVVGGATATTLLLKNRLIEPGRLVWLGRIRELGGIHAAGDSLEIGASSTLRDISRSEIVRQLAPALGQACEAVGNPRVRAAATLGGALVHGDPRQDIPPVMLSHRAAIEIRGKQGSRIVAARDFFLGFMETAVSEGEIVTAVVLPSRTGWRDRYIRFTPGSDDDYPTVGVAVSLLIEGDGEIDDAEVALGGVDATAVRCSNASALLIGTRGEPEVRRAVASAARASIHPTDDQRGSADYKAEMVEVWVERALQTLTSESAR